MQRETERKNQSYTGKRKADKSSTGVLSTIFFFLIHYCLLLELNQELQFSSNGISNKVNIFVFSLLLLRNQKVKEKCIKHDQRKERWLFSCNFLYILMIKARLSVFDFAHFR